MESLEQCFEIVSEYCKANMSETSHSLFIKPLKPVSMADDVITLSITSDWLKNTVQERYLNLLQNGFTELLGFPITVKIESISSVSQNIPLSQNLAAIGDTTNTFENFVVGPGNRFAHAAAQAVASNPAAAYNPLFIYGGSGLGKTHLLFAIKNELAKTRPDMNVMYIQSETFTNELITAISQGSTESFHNKYRTVDALLVDDVQFIGGKESTQEEFFHTFNALTTAGKQIVLTSDRPPKEIKSLTERLQTRFESGLMADITPPEYETRVSILKRKAEELGYPISDDIAQYIADNIKDNIRQLEGIVKKLSALRIMENSSPSISDVQNAIKDIMRDERPVPVTVDKIITEVSRTFDISEDDIKSQKRDAEIVNARQIAMYVTREVTGLTHESIGEKFGGKDHATVTHSLKKVRQMMDNDPRLKDMVEDIITNSRN
ncbi:MAG: chromosomal replication initiator protein DnaA [Oscillospiraceae bacterium]|nr:chromosomal replication initiator protein DnaA [Oscillospiraceae bacterium]